MFEITKNGVVFEFPNTLKLVLSKKDKKTLVEVLDGDGSTRTPSVLQVASPQVMLTNIGELAVIFKIVAEYEEKKKTKIDVEAMNRFLESLPDVQRKEVLKAMGPFAPKAGAKKRTPGESLKGGKPEGDFEQYVKKVMTPKELANLGIPLDVWQNFLQHDLKAWIDTVELQ